MSNVTGWDLGAGNESSGNKQNFTKFPVGVTRVRLLDDAPNMRWVHWLPQYSRSVNCPGRGCPIDEIRRQQKANGEPYTYAMGRRFAMNIYNHETNQLEIMEQGVGFFEDVKDLMTDLREQGKSLKDVTLKVRRRGTGKDDTSYRVDIDEELPLSDAESKAMIEKIDLSEYFKPHTPEQILAIIQFRADSREKYVEHWNNVMSGDSDNEVGEEIEVR